MLETKATMNILKETAKHALPSPTLSIVFLLLSHFFLCICNWHNNTTDGINAKVHIIEITFF